MITAKAQAAAAAALGLATPVLTWVLIGPQHETGDPADVVIAQPSMPYALGVTTVVAALAAAAWAVATFGRAVRSGSLSKRAMAAAIVLVLLGAFLGLWARVATAKVVGANIGFGLLVLSSPFVIGGAIVAVAIAAFAGRSRPHHPSPPPAF